MAREVTSGDRLWAVLPPPHLLGRWTDLRLGSRSPSSPPKASQGAEKGQSRARAEGLECPGRRQVYGRGNGRQAPGGCPATPCSVAFVWGAASGHGIEKPSTGIP